MFYTKKIQLERNAIAEDLVYTIVYSGFAHFCFWQCSESMLTGSLPVHDAPPINALVSALFWASSLDAWLSFTPSFLAESPGFDFLVFFPEFSLSKTM